MTTFSFTSIPNSEWHKKIEAGLRKECEALIGIKNLFKVHSIYVKNEDTFVGGMIVEHHGDILWIDAIWVEPNYRRKGIGKRLFQESQVFASQNKVKVIQLNTYFQKAHDFFLACGFEDVALIPNWKYDLTCYLMRKIM